MKVSGRLHVPAALSPRKSPQYPLYIVLFTKYYDDQIDWWGTHGENMKCIGNFDLENLKADKKYIGKS
jgi:hypothetical protein